MAKRGRPPKRPVRQLYSCPFCGGKEFTIDTDGEVSWVVCENQLCRATGPTARPKLQAIERWDLRDVPPPGTVTRAELEAALQQCLERFERCCVGSGSTPEAAASAVDTYRKLLAKSRASAAAHIS